MTRTLKAGVVGPGITTLTGARGFDDFNALLALPELEAVSICLPDRLHEKASLSRAPYLQHYREAYDAIPVLDALAQLACTGQPMEVER